MKKQLSSVLVDANVAAKAVTCAGSLAAALAATLPATSNAAEPPQTAQQAYQAQARVANRQALPAAADTTASADSYSPLNVDAGKGTLLRLNEEASSVFVADPTVADVHVPSPKAVFVLGKKSGTTTLYAL